MNECDAASLSSEALLLSRHLLGCSAAPELASRYARACRVSIPDASDADVRLLSVALRFPILLGPIDTAAALMRPQSVVRKKLLLMAAILEATPEHAERFLPRAPSLVGLIALCAGLGLKTAVQLPIGAAIIWGSERAR